MKVVTIFFIILVALVAYSVFDQYLSKGDFLDNFQLQKNSSQENSSKTNKTLTATVSEPIKQKSDPNPAPEPKKEEATKETTEETTEETTNISPYSGKVKISGIQAKSYYHPSLITFNYWLREGDKINITKWRIKARKGEIIIPQAIEKYLSYTTPRDIILKQYGSVYFIGSSNPLGRNKNFCLNKCFGYLAKFRDFYPSIYTYCPKPSLEEISHLNPYCQEFILRLPRCEIPDYPDNLKIMSDMECRNYMSEIFYYRSCFKNHSRDDDFLMNYWYVYVGRDIVEPLHDTIYLYDQNGLLVDKYLY